jgi:hypothetical protein
MKTHGSSWPFIMRIGGSVGGAHRATPKRAVRARATRGILVLALMLGGLGAAALALPAHGSASQAHNLSMILRPWML